MRYDHIPAQSATHTFRHLSDYSTLICLLPIVVFLLPTYATISRHISAHVAVKSLARQVRIAMQNYSHFELLDPTCDTVVCWLLTDCPIPDLPVFDGYVYVIYSLVVCHVYFLPVDNKNLQKILSKSICSWARVVDERQDS